MFFRHLLRGALGEDGELVVGGGGEVGGGEGAGDGDVEGDHGGLAVVGGEEEVDLDASVDGGAEVLLEVDSKGAFGS